LFAYLTIIFEEAIEKALALITLLGNFLFLLFIFFLLALICNNVISDLGKVLLQISQLFDEKFLNVVELGLSLLQSFL
jgi:hypothetical protein